MFENDMERFSACIVRVIPKYKPSPTLQGLIYMGKGEGGVL